MEQYKVSLLSRQSSKKAKRELKEEEVYRTVTMNKKEIYEGVMKTIKWSKVSVPVSKNPFGDQVDKVGSYDENV